MAGYLIAFFDFDSLIECIQTGVYSAWINPMTRGNSTFWTGSGMGGFADYASMKAGDDVYFFSQRNIYGIGKIIDVAGSCKCLNYPGAIFPESPSYDDLKDNLLRDYGIRSESNRVLSFFKPEPYVFRNGVDMDDLLKSSPGRFKVLPFWSGATFLRIGDEENQAFRDMLLKTNATRLKNPSHDDIFESDYDATHSAIAEKLADSVDYEFKFSPLLDEVANGRGKIKLESLIEATLVSQISDRDQQTIELLGEWDYVSRQVPASPPKSPEYIDRMDIFGLSYIPSHRPTVSKYFVAELKADWVGVDDLLQLMKYVDWIKDEYASGDYSMVRAYLIGFRFRPELFAQFRDLAERQFVGGSHGKVFNRRWDEVSLIQYSYSSVHKKILLAHAEPE